MFMTHEKKLETWVLLLEQESYLSYINLDYKSLDYEIYTASLKNGMQKTFFLKNQLIGEN